MQKNDSEENTMSRTKAYRAALLHCLADPREVGIEASHEYFADGLLVVEDGKVARIGAASELLPALPSLKRLPR